MHDYHNEKEYQRKSQRRFKTVNGMEACTTGVVKLLTKLLKADQGFKTVNGMEACATVESIRDWLYAKNGFKTVNGMEACATRQKDSIELG